MSQLAQQSSGPVNPVPPEQLPDAYLIEGLPVEYHGPIDFPCFGAAVRSMAAFDGMKVSKNTFMFPGSLRYGYTYQQGERFINMHPDWVAHGFRMANEYAAAISGIAIQGIDHAPSRSWGELWTELKGYVAAGRPVYVCFRNMEILWNSVGRELNPLWDSSAHGGAVAHCIVLVGYDEDRGVGIFHDNFWFYKNTGDVDIPYIEYSLESCEQGLANRHIPAPFVITGRQPREATLPEILAIQADIILGRKWNSLFEPPELPGVATGYAALLAAADDLERVATEGVEQIVELLEGYRTVLQTEWFLGSEGQPARTGWFSGVALATGNESLEEVAYHLDESATQWARARWHYGQLRETLSSDTPDQELARDKARAMAECFRSAGEHERQAGERLEAAVGQLS